MQNLQNPVLYSVNKIKKCKICKVGATLELPGTVVSVKFAPLAACSIDNDITRVDSSLLLYIHYYFYYLS